MAVAGPVVKDTPLLTVSKACLSFRMVGVMHHGCLVSAHLQLRWDVYHPGRHGDVPARHALLSWLPHTSLTQVLCLGTIPVRSKSSEEVSGWPGLSPQCPALPPEFQPTDE